MGENDKVIMATKTTVAVDGMAVLGNDEKIEKMPRWLVIFA